MNKHMNRKQARRIAIMGGLALSFGTAGASMAATGPTTTTRNRTTAQASRPATTVSKGSKTTKPVPTTRPSGSAAASLIISGFVSTTLTEARLTTPRCHPKGPAANAAFEFDGPNSRYVLELFLPIGTTTFPSTNRQAYLSLLDVSDPSKRWLIGNPKLPPTVGTATFDGTKGTVDAEMLPGAPNPALTPIHVKGSFTCAYGPP